MTTADVVLTGLRVPEGPAVLPDGRIVFTEQTRGAVSVYDGQRPEVLAVTGGAPNAVAPGADDALYVCQNGGVVGAWRSPDPRPPAIQRIDATGRVTTVADEGEGTAFGAPNDLCFGADGRLHFTDPAQPFDPADRRDTGTLWAIGPEGVERLRHVGAVYCNGIAVGAADELIWVESYTRRVLLLGSGPGADRVLATLPEGHVPDGIAVAADGRIFVASCGSHGIDVVGPDGAYAGFVRLDDTAFPSNLCFDGGALWVTDFGVEHARTPAAGRLWRLDTDAVGLPLHRGTLTPDRPTHPQERPLGRNHR